MRSFLCRVRQFLDNEDGPTAVEYAIMMALIMVACMNMVSALGHSTSPTFSKVNASLS